MVEFNARFGDPETQVVLNRLATPLAGLLHARRSVTWGPCPRSSWHPGAAVTVVIAAAGYPDSPAKGDAITIGNSRGTARRLPPPRRHRPATGDLVTPAAGCSTPRPRSRQTARAAAYTAAARAHSGALPPSPPLPSAPCFQSHTAPPQPQ